MRLRIGQDPGGGFFPSLKHRRISCRAAPARAGVPMPVSFSSAFTRQPTRPARNAIAWAPLIQEVCNRPSPERAKPGALRESGSRSQRSAGKVRPGWIMFLESGRATETARRATSPRSQGPRRRLRKGAQMRRRRLHCLRCRALLPDLVFSPGSEQPCRYLQPHCFPRYADARRRDTRHPQGALAPAPPQSRLPSLAGRASTGPERKDQRAAHRRAQRTGHTSPLP